MERAAFVMQLKKGCENEYKRRHDEIWPGLKSLLSDAGISDYSIFLEEASGKLFAVQKTSSGAKADTLGDEPIVKEWWDYMADIMEVNEDNSPVCIPLNEVFYMN